MVFGNGAVTEKVLSIGQPWPLIGVLTLPADGGAVAGRPAVLLLNAGILHRVGPNRIHVKIARRIAAQGYSVLRFDLSGIGDSVARSDNRSFGDRALSEIGDAMDAVQRHVGTDRFILFGICSGADLAFRSAIADGRVVGAWMVNGSFVHADAIRELSSAVRTATASRFYGRRLLEPRRWWRLVTGKSDRGRIRDVLSAAVRRFPLPPAASPGGSAVDDSEWRGLVSRSVAVSIVFSEGSAALDVYRLVVERALRELTASGAVELAVIGNTDHVFTLLWSQELLIDRFSRWIGDERRAWHS